MEEIRPGQHHCQEIWPSRGFRAHALASYSTVVNHKSSQIS